LIFCFKKSIGSGTNGRICGYVIRSVTGRAEECYAFPCRNEEGGAANGDGAETVFRFQSMESKDKAYHGCVPLSGGTCQRSEIDETCLVTTYWSNVGCVGVSLDEETTHTSCVFQ